MFPALEEPAKYISALLVLDGAIAKAKGADPRDPFTRAAGLELRLVTVLSATFNRRARKATVWAADKASSYGGKLDEREVFLITHGIESFFDGFAVEVADTIHAVTSEAYKLGKEVGYAQAFNAHLKKEPPAAPIAGDVDNIKKAVPKGTKFLEVKPNFTLKDKAAIDALYQHQAFWVGKFYSDKLSERITQVSKQVLLAGGESNREAGKQLQDALTKQFGFDESNPHEGAGVSLPTGWKGSPLGYFEGLAANAVTIGRNHGQIGAYSEIGVVNYEIVNPMDERSCVVCSLMAGKVFSVETARKMQEEEVEEQNPEAIKTSRPWARSKGDLDKMAGGDVKGGHESAAETKQLAAAGFAYAPFHYKCRCSTDVSEDTEIQFEPAPPKPAEPVAAPPTPAPVPLEQLPHDEHPGNLHGLPTGESTAPPPPPAPAAGEFEWTEKQLKVKNEQLGGMHEKTVFTAPDGSEWIFKPQEDWRALVDVAANNVQRLLGIETNDVFLVRLQGKTGSIQRRFTGVTGSMAGIALDKIGTEDMVAIQREHIYDWLVSQHDTHQDNLLRTKDGVRGIDKGQAFRFFGKDRFDLTYGQPGEPNPSGTFYNTLFNAYASGKNVTLAPFSQIEAFLGRIEATDNSAFVMALRPYAQKAFEATNGWGGQFKSPAEFLVAAYNRKNNLRETVEAFYKDLEERRAKALGLPKGKKPKVHQAAPAAPPASWQQRLDQAVEGKWQGTSFFVAGSDYENFHWNMYGTDGDGSFMESRLRPAADKKLRTTLGILADSQKAEPELPRDPWYADVLAIAKHYNFHMDPASSGYDGKIKPEILAKAKGFALSAKQAMTNVTDENEKQAVSHYVNYLSKIFDGAAFKPEGLASKGDAFKLMQFVPKPKEAKPEPGKKDVPPAGWKIERVASSDPIGRKLSDGKIVATGKPETGEAQRARDAGGVFKIRTPDGITIYYQAHDPKVAYSAQGKIRIHVENDLRKVTAADVERVFRNLETLGLETRAATKDEMELLYLRKVAFKEKLDGETNAIGETLPVADQISKLKELLSSRTGAQFSGKKYTFEPTWDSGKEGIGQPRWLAHYIDDKKLKGYAMHTSLTYSGGGSTGEKFKEIVKGGTNVLGSIVERMRLGVYSTAASPTTDMESGGASYIFTRVKRASSGGQGIIFKPELFKDLDAVHYDSDMYGRVQPHVLKTRKKTDDLGDLTGNSSNETIIKHTINLEKWMDRVVVDSESERTGVISFLRARGYTTWGGRPLEDVVKTR